MTSCRSACGIRAGIVASAQSAIATERKMYGIRSSAIAYACFIVAAVSAPAQAQTQAPTLSIWVGGLTCSTDPRLGMIVGSRQNMSCVFVASSTGEHYTYRGTINRVGLDVGVTRGGTLFWGVFARNSRVGRATLRGRYVGVSADASVGLGLGANVLIGGSRRTMALQPLSTTGQTGLNLALGVSSLVLR